tara:strand:- start:2223 stop:2582 length:360 start_codon:yes stop_codon:yes gene_type:complete
MKNPHKEFNSYQTNNMDIFENAFITIDKLIKKIIEKEAKKIISNRRSITHNHPPTNQLVDDCPYCKKFGNILMKINSVKELTEISSNFRDINSDSSVPSEISSDPSEISSFVSSLPCIV